jgi:hypothetical protein
MDTTKRLYRYRVPVVRRGQDGQVADPALREHIYLHATNAIAAQLLARAVTGAAIALEPERLGEVMPPESHAEGLAACVLSPNGGCVVFA